MQATRVAVEVWMQPSFIEGMASQLVVVPYVQPHKTRRK